MEIHGLQVVLRHGSRADECHVARLDHVARLAAHGTGFIASKQSGESRLSLAAEALPVGTVKDIIVGVPRSHCGIFVMNGY